MQSGSSAVRYRWLHCLTVHICQDAAVHTARAGKPHVFPRTWFVHHRGLHMQYSKSVDTIRCMCKC
jgi:hypothetical protein